MWECPYGVINCTENDNGMCMVEYEEDLDCGYEMED